MSASCSLYTLAIATHNAYCSEYTLLFYDGKLQDIISDSAVVLMPLRHKYLINQVPIASEEHQLWVIKLHIFCLAEKLCRHSIANKR